ncbi:hypothetical protein SAMN04488107_4089 [Geodermatophilus saharensis]|uniref:ABC-2 type transport system permease protein n=1 Tax=Geodermatophilus saharensis TaxID=1137994 RepID=A0A239I0T6_9ACTN|nr:hypothetical protein [Geodermatophilus saharensis]SNS87119.1 hypothetical protein SAMN04488107_4089 [Geodermatophilus saharensis]
MNRVLAAARLHLMNPVLTVGIPWGIALLSFCVNLALWATVGVGEESPGATTGGVASLYITVLVVFVQSVTQIMPFAMGMSLSRRTFYLGTALAAVGVALAYGAVLAVLAAVEGATGGWGVGLSFWAPGRLDVDNAALQVLVSGAPLLAAAFLGVAIGVVVKRWGPTGLWSLVVGAILFFGGLAILVSWQRAWGDVGSWLVAQSVVTLAVAIPLVVVLVTAALAFAGLRRVVP